MKLFIWDIPNYSYGALIVAAETVDEARAFVMAEILVQSQRVKEAELQFHKVCDRKGNPTEERQQALTDYWKVQEANPMYRAEILAGQELSAESSVLEIPVVPGIIYYSDGCDG